MGGWRTMVEAVAVHTFGLGGDSEVRLNDSGGIVVGPRRRVPLSLLAHQHPAVLDVLRWQLDRKTASADDGLMAVRQRASGAGLGSLTSDQLQLWELLRDAQGIVSLADLFAQPRQAYFRRLALAQLVDRGAVAIAGFTPTDAAHVLGFQADWSAEAAQLGAQIWTRRTAVAPVVLDAFDGQDAISFCRRVIGQVQLQAGRALVSAALAEAHGAALSGNVELQRLFVDRPLDGLQHPDAVLDVMLTLRRPIVAIGAPVATYYPAVAERLHTRLCIPPYAGIANAVGAVAGGVMQTVRAWIKIYEDVQAYRVHLPGGIHDFPDLEQAAAFAMEQVAQLAERQAREAGATDVQVQVNRRNHIAHIRKEDFSQDMFIDSEVVAMAFGRPRVADR